MRDAALTWRSQRKSFSVYQAEKATPSAGALALVNSRICLATSMATPTRALLISNLNDFQTWATFSSSTTALVSWRSTRTPLVTLSASESDVVASPPPHKKQFYAQACKRMGFYSNLTHYPLGLRTAPPPLLSRKRIASATGPNISPFVGPSSLNNSAPPSATFKSSPSAEK